MRIGVVTFYGVNNYGAMLQAYALQSFLELRGHEVVQINNKLSVNSECVSLWNLLYARSLKTWVFKIKLWREGGRMWRRVTLPFLRASLHGTNVRLKKGRLPPELMCDVYLVGSDQMWNVDFSARYKREVFLDFAPDHCKRLAYAVSMGGRIWDEKDWTTIAPLLKKFNALSVREDVDIKKIKKIAEVSAEWMPDPTLLHRADFYKKSLIREQEAMTGHSFVFGYLFGEREIGQFTKQIHTFLNTQSEFIMRIYPFINIVKVEMWLKKISDSAFVITNSFHGVVFSLIFHRPFVVLLATGSEETKNIRIISLLKELELESRIFSRYDKTQLAVVLNERIDWVAVDEKIAIWRTSANLFFNREGL